MLKRQYVKDWTPLAGACVEIRIQGQLVDSGRVDCVTNDGAILWLINPARIRKLYEKADDFEAWVIEERAASKDRMSISTLCRLLKAVGGAGASGAV